MCMFLYDSIFVCFCTIRQMSLLGFELIPLLQKENQNHRQALKGGAFRLNMHPQSYFDGNPYRSDKPLGPPKKEGSTVKDIKPFKPSSPAKAVRSAVVVQNAQRNNRFVCVGFLWSLLRPHYTNVYTCYVLVLSREILYIHVFLFSPVAPKRARSIPTHRILWTAISA